MAWGGVITIIILITILVIATLLRWADAELRQIEADPFGPPRRPWWSR